nr:MAG: RNA dependent RNA polymerase [Leviviridae sp.]
MKPTKPALVRANKVLSRLSHSRYVELLKMLCARHGSFDFAQEILRLLRSKSWAELLSYADSLSSQSYDDATRHFVANQFASLVRKYPWNPVDVLTDPEGTALKKWLSAEHACKRHNQRFRLFQTLRSPHEDLLSRVRGFIRYVIGDSPNIERIYELCDYTGGASLGCHGNRTNIAAKLSMEDTVTPGALVHYYNALAANAPLLSKFWEYRDYRDTGCRIYCLDNVFDKYVHSVRVVTHNKIAFVPKTAKTLRPIAVEPVGNGFLQKGTDLYLRQCLKRVGLDLSDQSRNRFFSKFGSEDWLSPLSFCTIDLSSASDSIATEMCRAVLPPDWFSFLNDIRSREYMLQDSTTPKEYEKFCSMGNGFCFPLETLLFAAIAAASGAGIPRRDFVVYGDDIIVRKPHFDAVLRNLRIMGFKANTDKTFSEGPFRESCGADWYAGEDVRPYTLDHCLDSVQNMYKFLNLSRRNQRTADFFREVYPVVIGWLPTQFRLFRPFTGPADSGIDVEGFEHLVSPLINLVRKDSVFRWYELQSCPVRDKTEYPERVRILSLLRGDSTLYLRRRSTTRVVRKHGG